MRYCRPFDKGSEFIDTIYFRWVNVETALHGWLPYSMILRINELLRYEGTCKYSWEGAHVKL